jgi:tetratricopeptide (TPR) repeat protein
MNLEKQAPAKIAVFYGTGSILKGMGTLILAILVILAPLALTASAAPAGQTQEAILKQARGLLDQDINSPNQKNLQEAATLLEGAVALYPHEIRFPLYLAEAYYRLADPAADVDGEFHYYKKAGWYAQKALKMDPNRAEAHYWNGLFLLKKAQKRGGLGAYFIVKDGIKELEKVRKAMPAYDHAGASRVLGLLYCVAPGWSPFGDLDKSIELGKEATRIDPDYALNRMYLADAYHKRGDNAQAIREYQALLAVSAKMPREQGQGFSQKAREMLGSLGQPVQRVKAVVD